MKVFGKERKKQLKQVQMDIRDAKAFNLMLWFMVNVFYNDPWNYGPKRLQRIYDAVLDSMYESRDDKWVGWILEDWAIKMGLTEDDYAKRRAARGNGQV